MKSKIALIVIAPSMLAFNALAQPVEQLKPTDVSVTNRWTGAPARTGLVTANRTSTSKVIGVIPGALQNIQELANSGDAAAQKTLAQWLWDGQILEKDPVQSYKWAFVSVVQGNKDARHLLRELEVFMPSEDKQKGKAQAEQYIAEQKKKIEKPKIEPGETKK
jgi:TPR repeat protein